MSAVERYYYECRNPAGVHPAVGWCIRHTLPTEPGVFTFSRDEWIVDVSQEGDSTFRINSETHFHRRNPHEVHVYPPLAVRSETRPAILHGAAIIFTGGELLGLERLIAPETGYAIVDDRERLIEELLFGAPEQCSASGRDGWLTAQMYLYKIANLLRLARPRSRPGCWQLAAHDVETDRQWVGRVEQELRRDLAEGIPLQRLAAKMGCSVTTLNNRYREFTGHTIRQALLNIRVALVRVALESDRTLAQIAAETGFCDEFHLSKTFRRLTGMTPSQYRRRCRSGRTAPSSRSRRDPA